jgi:hypothetical protein
MTDVAALIRDLVADGVSADLIGRVAAALADRPSVSGVASADVLADRRARDAERKRKARALAVSASEERPRTERTPRARVEDKSLPTEQEPQLLFEEKKSESTSKRDGAEFRQALAELGSERLDALIKIRKAKRAPLTAYAAKLFIRDLQACGLSLADGADLAISRNWLTVKPEWLMDRRQQGPPGGRRMTAAEQTRENLRGRIDELHNEERPNSEGGGHLRLVGRVSSTHGKTD